VEGDLAGGERAGFATLLGIAGHRTLAYAVEKRQDHPAQEA
jgi:hypothetical protein